MINALDLVCSSVAIDRRDLRSVDYLSELRQNSSKIPDSRFPAE
jgi:hypothetical protein